MGRLAQYTRSHREDTNLDLLSDDPGIERRVRDWCHAHGAEVSSVCPSDDGSTHMHIRILGHSRIAERR